MIKHDGHLRTRRKCRKHEQHARVFISRVFSNVRSVFSQCNRTAWGSSFALRYRSYSRKKLNTFSMFYLRNRKHVPCFHRALKARVEVWENAKCCRNTSRKRVFPQLFRVLPNFHECVYNSIETRSTCFPFLLENVMRKRKTTCKL